jgi:hypothetical protein
VAWSESGLFVWGIWRLAKEEASFFMQCSVLGLAKDYVRRALRGVALRKTFCRLSVVRSRMCERRMCSASGYWNCLSRTKRLLVLSMVDLWLFKRDSKALTNLDEYVLDPYV